MSQPATGREVLNAWLTRLGVDTANAFRVEIVLDVGALATMKVHRFGESGMLTDALPPAEVYAIRLKDAT